jgi:hypothetical protein
MSSFRDDNAVLVETTVKEEKGQWVVYLSVIFWESEAALAKQMPEPLQIVRHRIQAYRSRRRAEIASHWIKRGAQRDLRNPPMGL